MSDVTDTGQGFSSKAVGSNGSQVLERLELGGCETLTQYWKIFFLLDR